MACYIYNTFTRCTFKTFSYIFILLDNLDANKQLQYIGFMCLPRLKLTG